MATHLIMARFCPCVETASATRGRGPGRGLIGNSSAKQALKGGLWPFDRQTWVLGTPTAPLCLQIRPSAGTLGKPSRLNCYSLYCNTSLAALTLYSFRARPEHAAEDVQTTLRLCVAECHTSYDIPQRQSVEQAKNLAVDPGLVLLSYCCGRYRYPPRARRPSEFSQTIASHWDIVAQRIGVNPDER